MFLSRFITPVLLLLFAGSAASTLAQGFKQELDTPEKVTVSIKNLEGRVSVVASKEQDKKMSVEANSTGQAIASDDVKVDARGARITIDVPAATTPGGDISAAPPPPPPPTDTLPVGTRARFAVIAIDPGHGGDDIGVRTGDGLQEKELTLDVARRVRQRLETRLGVRAILTRDDDRSLSLDERAAFANNNKADLFLSLHANGALGSGPHGAEVYFLRLDREGETVRRTANADAVSLPVLGGGRRLLEVVPWNLAQAAYTDKSEKLASLLEEELRRRVPMSPRAVQRAGMRVLTGANMPAALVEMAYLTNREQASKARGDDFRNAIADALYEAVARFRAAAIEKPTP